MVIESLVMSIVATLDNRVSSTNNRVLIKRNILSSTPNSTTHITENIKLSTIVASFQLVNLFAAGVGLFLFLHVKFVKGRI